MNKLLILLLLVVIIQIIVNLLNYKEGLCPSSCSKCMHLDPKSILYNIDDCGKECIQCENITISDYFKSLLNNLFGSTTTSTSESGSTTTSESKSTSGSTKSSNSIFTHNQIKHLWADVSNGLVRPSVYTCTKDNSDNWVPYENGESLCVLDVNGIWRQYEDISGLEDCEPVKCIADFGTEIGQLTCCGQNSTLKSTKYVCPSNLPTCNNFKCGSEFGICSK